MEIDLNLAEMTLLIVDREFLFWQTKYQIIFHIMAYIQPAKLSTLEQARICCVMCWCQLHVLGED